MTGGWRLVQICKTNLKFEVFDSRNGTWYRTCGTWYVPCRHRRHRRHSIFVCREERDMSHLFFLFFHFANSICCLDVMREFDLLTRCLQACRHVI